MSRKYSSNLNLGGMADCLILRSPSRSPSRPRVTARSRSKKNNQPVLVDDNVMEQGPDLPPHSPSEILQNYVESLADEYVPRAINNDCRYVLLPEVNLETGDLIRDIRRLSYRVVEIDGRVYRCSCNKTLSAALDSLLDRSEHYVEQLKGNECIHARAVRKGEYDQPHGSPFIYGAITPIGDKLRLFVTFPDGSPPGVVRATQSKVCCLLCHKETCPHVREISGSPYLDQVNGDGEGEGVEESRIQWKKELSRLCTHDQPIHSRSKQCTIANDRGITRQEMVVVEKSSCCTHIVYSTPTPVFCYSEGLLLELPLLQFYESLLAMTGATLSGYWRSLKDYAGRMGGSAPDIISLSSLSRAWNSYLSQLEIPDHKFGCEICGQFPTTLVFDGLQMGIRTSIANVDALARGQHTFPDSPLPYLGKMQQRKAMKKFVKGKGDIPNVVWPIPVQDLLNDAINEKKQVKEEYKELLRMLFANSPLPLLFQAGISGERRAVLDRLIDGSFVWHDEELALQRAFPTIYRSLRPLISNDAFPDSVRKVLEYVVVESDALLKMYPHIEAFYGPPKESQLECFPLWPLERGITRYCKDKNKEEQLECAEKVVGENQRLSPGLMLVMCTHRRPYGFRVLKTPESVRDVFQIVLTRLGSRMPTTVIYDNACHLAVYSLAREPSRFCNVRFLVDRFHSTNHKSCAHALRLTSYQSDPTMAALNSQSCEQTNALLRHLGNSLPFMSLSRYIKTLHLSLSRN